ncbi:MAG TPA: BRO-N domain-containing protein [Xylella sp.]
MSQLPSTVCFSGHYLSIIDRDGTPYLSARDLARALGYADERSVLRIYARRADEFTSQMTTVVNLTTVTGDKPTRIFSPRGCHLVAIFSRTSAAAAFRHWVLDVLEGVYTIHKTGSCNAMGTVVDDDVLYAIQFLCGHFRALHQMARVNKMCQALAWLGAKQISGELYDRLMDGLHGGVHPIEKALGPHMEQAAQRVLGERYRPHETPCRARGRIPNATPTHY